MFFKCEENGWKYVRCASPLSSLPLHRHANRNQVTYVTVHNATYSYVWAEETFTNLRYNRSRWKIAQKDTMRTI